MTIVPPHHLAESPEVRAGWAAEHHDELHPSGLQKSGRVSSVTRCLLRGAFGGYRGRDFYTKARIPCDDRPPFYDGQG